MLAATGHLIRGDSARRIQWGFVDQAVSSFTNFAIGLVVARVAAPRQFGVYSLAFTLYAMLLWVSRSVTTDPFVVRLTARPAPEQRAAARQAVGAATVVGLASGVAMGMVAGAGGAATGRIVGAMALAMPAFLAQDSYRYVLFAAGRARSAAVNDSVWLLTEIIAVAALYATGHATTAAVVAAFGLGAGVAAVCGAGQTGVAPSLRSCYRWVRDHRDLAVPYVLELMTIAGVVQVALLIVAAVSGAVAIGALRAAMLLLGPLTVLFLGVLVAGVPEAVRLRQRSGRALSRLVLFLGVAMPAASGLLTGAIMLLPTRVGRDVLGANWAPGRHVLPAVGVMVAGQGCALAATVGLRALGAARRSLGARLWGAPVFLIGGVAGAMVDGAFGAAVGLAVAAWLDAGLVWGAFGRAQRQPAASATEARPDRPPAANGDGFLGSPFGAVRPDT